MSERLLARDDFFFCLLLLASFSVLFPESGDDSSAAAEVEGAPIGRWLLGIMWLLFTQDTTNTRCAGKMIQTYLSFQRQQSNSANGLLCRIGTLKVLMYDPNVGRLKGKDTATEDIGR